MTCEACDGAIRGLYIISCKRCEARAYVVAPDKHQRVTRLRWKTTLSPEEIGEMQKLCEEERAKV